MWHFSSPTFCAPLAEGQRYLAQREQVEPRDETVWFAMKRAQAVVEGKQAASSSAGQ